MIDVPAEWQARRAICKQLCLKEKRKKGRKKEEKKEEHIWCVSASTYMCTYAQKITFKVRILIDICILEAALST